MAKNEYSADSAPMPQPPSPSGDLKTGAFAFRCVPASSLKDRLPATKIYVLADSTGTYVGETDHFVRRLTGHAPVHRQADETGTPSPTSID
jgi:hypothetical protein